MGTGLAHTAVLTADHTLLDGISVEEDQQATVHVEGLVGQAGASKWGVTFSSLNAPVQNDTAGNPRVNLQGGFRGGPVARDLGVFSGTALTGNVPWYPITCWHRNLSLQRVYPLGVMPDVRALNIRGFQAKEEVVVSGDTWVVFPFALRTEDNVTNRTYYSGIAYKKVTT
jgi:hypothetical protein